jgi:hypothetical protein
MLSASFVNGLMLVWAAVTVGFIGVMIVKSLTSMKEEDVVILDPNEAHLAAEQAQLVAKVEHLTSWAKRLGFTSLGLLVVVGSVWAYRAVIAFNTGQNP